jgi:error-prone DNA polymerase
VRRQYELALAHPHENLRFGGVDQSERLLAEYAVLGFAASAHPLSLLAGSLPPGAVRSDRLGGHEHGEILEVVGMVVARQRPQTAKGFVFILLEDEGGMSNVIVHPDVYEKYRLTIRGEPLLWVKGKLAKDDGTVNIIAEEVRALAVGGAGSDAAAEPAAAQPLNRPTAFLKAMRTLAPDSKDWG